MKNYWTNLGPVMQHVHVFIGGAAAVLLVPMMEGSKPSDQQLWMALAAGLAACFGLQLPAPKKD